MKVSSPRWVSKFQIKPNSWVFVPTEEMIQYGLILKQSIEKHWIPPNYYYHLRDGGHVKALKVHIESQFFIFIDIQNFFGSINRSRVTRCIKDCFGYDVAREIAIKSTVKSQNKFILPFGFVQSPIIASLCLYKSRLGTYLHKLKRKKIANVSVYMDDIIISDNDVEPLRDIMDEITDVAIRAGFVFNRDKTLEPSEKITAFNINLSHGSLEIQEERFKEFCTTYAKSESDDQRQGILNYILSVNKAQADKII